MQNSGSSILGVRQRWSAIFTSPLSYRQSAAADQRTKIAVCSPLVINKYFYIDVNVKEQIRFRNGPLVTDMFLGTLILLSKISYAGICVCLFSSVIHVYPGVKYPGGGRICKGKEKRGKCKRNERIGKKQEKI